MEGGVQEFYLNKVAEKFMKFSDKEKLEYINNIKDCASFWIKEIKEKKDVSKNAKKIQNTDLEGYERFKAWNFIEYFSFNRGINSGFFARNKKTTEAALEKAYDNNKISSDELFKTYSVNELGMMTHFFNEVGKIFRINQEIFSLLRNTDVEIKYQEIPFEQIFIQTNELIINDVEIFGVLLRKRIVNRVNEYDKYVQGHGVLEMIAIGIDLSDGENIWFWENVFEDDNDLKESIKNNKYHNKYTWCDEDSSEKIRKEFRKISINFLNLINHPEVEMINHSKRELRENRIRKGRLGIPDSVEINLTGKLRKYIYQDLPKQKEAANNYAHKFWVRGHWMNFTSERYINMKGKKKWVLPYIKGRGELISKDYYLGEKERQWEHENRMKKIIRSIYPDKEINNNIRTELNGLEIDCYIPELKLGFEYNGEQHYNHIEIFHKTKEDFEAQKQRDIKKNELAKERGIRLITIRYDELLTEKLILSKINEVENGNKE